MHIIILMYSLLIGIESGAVVKWKIVDNNTWWLHHSYKQQWQENYTTPVNCSCIWVT